VTVTFSTLGEVAEFINGAAFKPQDWGEIGNKIIRIQNLTDKSKPFNRTTRQINERLHVHHGDLLVSWSATLGVFEWEDSEVGLLNQHIFRVLANPNKVDKRYLRHALELALLDMRKHMHGATMLHVNRGEFLSTKLYLPSISEQRRIAAILDQADALRAKRREALAHLDSLTQSIFVEMFGDPITNPLNWPRVTLGDLVLSASDGPHVSPKYSDTGVPFLSTRHVRPGEISWEDLKFITSEEAAVQWKKCKPERGDLLYTKGGTTGFAAVVNTDESFAIWVHVALLKPNFQKVDSTWLESMINTGYCYRQSQELTHGIANRDLGLKRMIRIGMYQPPIELQRKFALRSSSVDVLKSNYRKSLAELDTLFVSLQHQAFRGEL